MVFDYYLLFFWRVFLITLITSEFFCFDGDVLLSKKIIVVKINCSIENNSKITRTIKRHQRTIERRHQSIAGSGWLFDEKIQFIALHCLPSYTNLIYFQTISS